MREYAKHYLLLVLAACLITGTNLGAMRLWDEDEPKNATCAAEMLSRGDWIVPTFNGELRTDKPILLYWCMLVTYSVCGVNEFAARLPSAICALGTVLLTYHLGRKLFGAATGLWAGLLLASSLMFVASSRAATPDALLIFFSTLALTVFVHGSDFSSATRAPAGTNSGESLRGLPSGWLTYLFVYEAMALATLAKGPVGFVLPTAVIVLYLVVINAPRRAIGSGEIVAKTPALGRLRSTISEGAVWICQTLAPHRVLRVAWAMRPLTALTVLALVALPWYLVVGSLTNWDWPKGFFWHHNFERYANSLEGHRGLPFYHFFSIAAGFFPASVFLLPMVVFAARQLRGDHPQQRGYVLAACWILVYLVVFSFCGTKLPSYVTPTYPALALLTGALLGHWVLVPSRADRIWQSLPVGVLGLTGGLVLALTIFLASGLLNTRPAGEPARALSRLAATHLGDFLAGQWSLLPLGVILIIGALATQWQFRCSRPRRAALCFVIAATLFSTTLFGWGMKRMDRFQESAAIARLLDQAEGQRPQLATYHVIRPSWVFYARQPVDQLADAQEAVRRLSGQEPSFLVVEENRLKELQPLLPHQAAIVARIPRFLKTGSLIILSNTTEARSADASAFCRDYSRR